MTWSKVQRRDAVQNDRRDIRSAHRHKRRQAQLRHEARVKSARTDPRMVEALADSQKLLETELFALGESEKRELKKART